MNMHKKIQVCGNAEDVFTATTTDTYVKSFMRETVCMFSLP